MKTPHRKKAYKGIFFFLVTLVACTLLSSVTIRHKTNVQRLSMERLIIEKSIKIKDVLSKLIYKTQALSSLVIQSDGRVDDFERIAATIVDDPCIMNILIAPYGIVSQVYPRQGNEQVLGFNLLKYDEAGNKEAVLAKDKGQLVFGGPFKTVQGGMALVGRLPVYLSGPDEQKVFWGLVSVTLRYPDALVGAGLDSLEREGFAYEIWRISPDDGQRQIIASSGYSYAKDVLFIEEHIPLFNADWQFRILPVKAWYEYYDNWLLIFAGLCISLLVGGIAANNEDLKVMKRELETMVRTDPLTGVLNRAGLFHELDALISRRRKFQIYYIDLNYFKQINDTYGHTVGDMVLIEFCRRVEKHLSGESRLSRISGDEFVLIHNGPKRTRDKETAFWERIAREFAQPFQGNDGNYFTLSFCRGTADFPDEAQSIDELIILADTRMYMEKNDQYSREKRRRASDLVAC